MTGYFCDFALLFSSFSDGFPLAEDAMEDEVVVEEADDVNEVVDEEGEDDADEDDPREKLLPER